MKFKFRKMFLTLLTVASLVIPISLTSCSDAKQASNESTSSKGSDPNQKSSPSDDNSGSSGSSTSPNNSGDTSGGNTSQNTDPSNPSGNTGDNTNPSNPSGNTGDNTDPTNPKPTVKDVVDTVKSAFRLFNIWDLFPESLKAENRLTNYTQQDFSNFVTLANITDMGIGKQMNQFYEILSYFDSIINAATIIYDAANTIANLYQTFVNNNPDNYANYEAETTYQNIDLKFKITLTDTDITVLAQAGSASVELDSNLDTGDYSGRIQITDGTALKYNYSSDEVKIGFKTSGAVTMMLDVDTSNSSYKLAKLYNFYGNVDEDGSDGSDDSVGLTTSSVMYVDNDYTAIIGKKGDFFFPNKNNRNMEVYDNATGKYVGSKVYEQATSFTTKYMTNWYPFQSISGFDDIKQTQDSDNNDEYYINDSSQAFVNEKAITSRKYDIEMKTVYLFDTDANGNTNKYSVQIPMFFIQDKYDDDSTYQSLNKDNNLNFANTTPSDLKTWMANEYTSLNDQYNSYNETTTPQTVDNYIGTENSWFS